MYAPWATCSAERRVHNLVQSSRIHGGAIVDVAKSYPGLVHHPPHDWRVGPRALGLQQVRTGDPCRVTQPSLGLTAGGAGNV